MLPVRRWPVTYTLATCTPGQLNSVHLWFISYENFNQKKEIKLVKTVANTSARIFSQTCRRLTLPSLSGSTLMKMVALSSLVVLNVPTVPSCAINLAVNGASARTLILSWPRNRARHWKSAIETVNMAKGENSCFINVESCRLKIEFHLGKAFKRMPEQGAKFANAKRHHLYALHSIIVSRKKVFLQFSARK